MLGIKFTWECPSCGTIIRTQEPFSNKKLRKSAMSEEPSRCSCGRKAGFTLVTFEECEYQFTEVKGGNE